jgi:hypothetical protein
MGAKRCQNYIVEFKSMVVIDVMRGGLALNEISTKYRAHTTQIN